MKKIDINKYRKIPFTKRERCMICTEKISPPLFALPQFPMTEIYVSQKVTEKVGVCDQTFHVCKKCGHGQVGNVIDVQLQYGDSISYNFRSSQSATGQQSADFFITFLKKAIKNKKLGTIVELGSNDMHILKALKNNAKKLIGIDPILAGREKEYSKGKLVAIGDFFEKVDLKDEHIDVVICKDTLEHVADPKQFVKKIIDVGTQETIYFFEFPLLETLVYNCRFDQIFHQHLNLFSFQSIQYMLKELGCQMVNYTINNNLWGSILIAFKKGNRPGKFTQSVRSFSIPEILDRYEIFKSSMQNTSRQLALLEKETIYGYGAALMLPVLAYHLHTDFSSYTAILDDDPHKSGLYYINLPVKIKQSASVSLQDAVVLITAISTFTNTRNIIARLAKLNPKKILIPLNSF